MCGAFSGRATSTAAVGVVHDSFISYSDGRRHRWSHNPFCVNRHDIFQNSTAEQRQFNETPSQRHVFCGKRHATASSVATRTRRQGCGREEAARGRRGRQTQQRGQGAGGALGDRAQLLAHEGRGQGRGTRSSAVAYAWRQGTTRSCVWANLQNSRATPHKAGSSTRTASIEIAASAARTASRPAPPEKEQNAQTKHLGMARFARRA